MTLPTWSNLVKQLPAHAKHIWLGGGLLLLALLAMQRLALDPQTQAEAYGELVAQSIAELCVGPLVKQDRIELGLVSNRMARLPGVTGVTLFGVDNQVLSVTTPNAQGSAHTQPITLDDAIIGYVQVNVDPGVIGAVARWPWLFALALLVLLPWLLSGSQWLLVNAQSYWLSRQSTQQKQTSVAHTPAPAAPADDYVLVASLLNQLGLSAPDHQALLATTASAAAQVAQLYQGHMDILPGKGLAIWFANDSADRAFEVACGGLLLARFLHQRNDQGKFQLGLHHHCNADDEAPGHGPAAVLRDAALLAAAAGEGQLVLSDVVAAGISRQERLDMEAMEHPLGTDFDSAGAQCYRLNDLAEGYASLIESQLGLLLNQDGSTAKESTF
ncbi:MAG: hypothetical protein ACR2PZ_12815 [Pseudomonadales bacterium]